ncbi:hypothetical protein D3C72_993670 [compost metagenome]
MRVYAPDTKKGRHLAGHDVHHKTADMPKAGANAQAKRLRKAARQQGRIQALQRRHHD